MDITTPFANFSYMDQLIANNPDIPPVEVVRMVNEGVEFYRKQAAEHINESLPERFGLVQVFFDFVDEQYKIEGPDAPKISCKKGCAFCCHNLVFASLAEAQYALATARENNIPVDEARLQEQAKITETHEFTLSKHRRCVFLADDNTCSVYEVRPFACRRYFVTTPPELCDTTRYKKGVTIEVAKMSADMAIGGMMAADSDSGTFAKMLLKAIGLEEK